MLNDLLVQLGEVLVDVEHGNDAGDENHQEDDQRLPRLDFLL